MPGLECPVCFGREWVTTTPCRHPICIECLLHLPKNECPSCRGEILSRLPSSLRSVVKMNPEKPIRETLNIFSQEQFPSL